jgi:hypothetical protein
MIVLSAIELSPENIKRFGNLISIDTKYLFVLLFTVLKYKKGNVQ